MKVYITLAVVCLIASAVAHHELTEEEKAEIEGQYRECAEQEKVSQQDVTKLRNKEFANATPAMKCLGACFFEKVGILKDSVVQEDVALDLLVPHYGQKNVTEALEKCTIEKGADRCEAGFKVYECIENARTEWGH